MNGIMYEIEYEILKDGVVVRNTFRTFDREIYDDMMARFTCSPLINILNYGDNAEELKELMRA